MSSRQIIETATTTAVAIRIPSTVKGAQVFRIVDEDSREIGFAERKTTSMDFTLNAPNGHTLLSRASTLEAAADALAEHDAWECAAREGLI